MSAGYWTAGALTPANNLYLDHMQQAWGLAAHCCTRASRLRGRHALQMLCRIDGGILGSSICSCFEFAWRAATALMCGIGSHSSAELLWGLARCLVQGRVVCCLAAQVAAACLTWRGRDSLC